MIYEYRKVSIIIKPLKIPKYKPADVVSIFLSWGGPGSVKTSEKRARWGQ